MNVDIYSDIVYNHYQHINQFLVSYFSKNISSRFLQRFYTHTFTLHRFCSLMKKIERKDSLIKEAVSENIKIKSVYNIPHTISCIDRLNSFFVKRQLGTLGDICITFVPSPSLKTLFNQYENVIYYCVHDSQMQNYSSAIKKYEVELITKSSIIFCDNEIVLHRLASYLNSEYSSIFDKEYKGKFLLVPPPVPDIFYDLPVGTDFDFIYFGSIHKDIDLNCFMDISKRGKKLLIISDEAQYLQQYSGIIVKPATANLDLLITYISKAKNILFPYRNSIFMNTISPAKLNQAFATGKPIICTNTKLTEDYGLIDYKEYFVRNMRWDYDKEKIYEFRCSLLISLIEDKINAL